MTELHDSLSEILLVILSQNSRHIVFTNIYQSQISPADLMKFLHFIVITNRWLINQKWNIFGPNLTNLMEKNTVTLILVVIGSWNLCSLLQFHLCTNTDTGMPAAIYLFLSIRRNKTQNRREWYWKNICSCWICSRKMLPCLSLLLKAMPHFDNVTQTNDCCIFPPDTMSICMPRASWFNPYRKKRPDINFEILSPIDKMRIRIFFFFYRKIKLKA